MAGHEDQGLKDQAVLDQSWPQRGGVFTYVPAWFAAGEEQGVSQGMSSRDSPTSSSPTFRGGKRGFRDAANVKKVVFAESAASPSSSPRQGECELVRHPRAIVFNRSQEDLLREEHCDGLKD